VARSVSVWCRRTLSSARGATKWTRNIALLLLGAYSFAGVPSLPPPEVLAQQRAQYDANTPKTILELQPFRAETRVPIRRADGTAGTATLTNLNPYVSSWYLLTVEWTGSVGRSSYHLESPQRRTLSLLSGDPNTIRIAGADGSGCTVWVSGARGALDDAGSSGLPYAPFCAGTLYLRNPVAGHHTSLERVTDFLRDRVWGGERVITFVKEEFYRDRFLEKDVEVSVPEIAREPPSPLAPVAAAVASDSAELSIVPQHLALDLAAPGKQLLPGQWYSVQGLAGVFASVIAPEHIDKRILSRHDPGVNPLGPVESAALAYLVAFDLQLLDLHFVLGTDHPRVDWSERALREPGLPGPDGVANAAPLVTNGMVNHMNVERTIATFAGGFKRAQGAFRYGPFADRNHGSHYGFIQRGVVFSKLQPGLATALVMDDGAVDVRTWTVAAEALLPHVQYARQNGVPLIEYDPTRGMGVPGELVNSWGAGNWSGSANEDLRTLRAGLCLQQSGQRRFLIYGYFSDATPSAMARIFQGYHCRYAMHLDMNALEHTYLALYVRRNQQRLVEHLIQGMQAVDRTARNQLAPRFLAFPDDRDFFYITKREGSP
jgi:hypothetical protein